MATILIPERVARIMSPEFHLRKGAGRGAPPEGNSLDCCATQAVDYAAGGDGTREQIPDCDPVINRTIIGANDWLADDERDQLKPYLLRAVGTLRTPAETIRRAYMVADDAVRVQGCSCARGCWAE